MNKRKHQIVLVTPNLWIAHVYIYIYIYIYTLIAVYTVTSQKQGQTVITDGVKGILDVSGHFLLDDLFDVLVGVPDKLLEYWGHNKPMISHHALDGGHHNILTSEISWPSPFLRWGKLRVQRTLMNFISMSSESALHASASSWRRRRSNRLNIPQAHTVTRYGETHLSVGRGSLLVRGAVFSCSLNRGRKVTRHDQGFCFSLFNNGVVKEKRACDRSDLCDLRDLLLCSRWEEVEPRERSRWRRTLPAPETPGCGRRGPTCRSWWLPPETSCSLHVNGLHVKDLQNKFVFVLLFVLSGQTHRPYKQRSWPVSPRCSWWPGSQSERVHPSPPPVDKETREQQ